MKSIEINELQVENIQALLGDLKDKYKTVVVTAINKTIKTTQTQATARIGNELSLKAARIKQDFTQQKANYNKLSGALIAKGEPVGLVQFAAKQTQKGVTVKVLRSSSRELVPHAFIAARGTKDHVFWRSTPRSSHPAARRFPVGKRSRASWARMPVDMRRPLSRLTGPRIEDIFAKPQVFDPVSIQAQHVFLQNVDKKINDVIRRWG